MTRAPSSVLKARVIDLVHDRERQFANSVMRKCMFTLRAAEYVDESDVTMRPHVAVRRKLTTRPVLKKREPMDVSK
jgi:hypothetical protein